MDDMSPAELDLFLGAEDEEVQDMPSDRVAASPHVEQVLEIRREAGGGTTVVELVADADGLLQPTDAPERRFASVQEALAYTGRTGLRTDGTLVAVVLDGRVI